jgi:hypothetical protein
MKKIICVLLAFAMVATCGLVNAWAYVPEDGEEWLYGDVLEDGSITGSDATLLKRYVYWASDMKPNINELAADVYQDSVVDVKDAAIILNYLFNTERPDIPTTPVSAEPISAGKISIDSTEYIKGSRQIEVTISAEDLPNVTALEIEVTGASEELTFAEVEKLNENMQETRGEDGSYPIPLPFSTSDGKNRNLNGPLCKLIFDVSDDVEVGNELFVNIAASDTYGGSFQIGTQDSPCDNMIPILYETVNGAVTVTETVYGDVNDDGDVNYIDIQFIREFVYLGTNESEINKPAADVFADDVIDAKDEKALLCYLETAENERPELPITPASVDPISAGKISVSSAEHVIGRNNNQVQLIVSAKGLPNVAALEFEITSLSAELTLAGWQCYSTQAQTNQGYYDYPKCFPISDIDETNKNFNGSLWLLTFDVDGEAEIGDEFFVNIAASNRYGGTFQIGDDLSTMIPVEYETQKGTITIVKKAAIEIALEILEYSVGRTQAIDDEADYNGDGVVNAVDAFWVLKKIMGLLD